MKLWRGLSPISDKNPHYYLINRNIYSLQSDHLLLWEPSVLPDSSSWTSDCVSQKNKLQIMKQQAQIMHSPGWLQRGPNNKRVSLVHDLKASPSCFGLLLGILQSTLNPIQNCWEFCPPPMFVLNSNCCIAEHIYRLIWAYMKHMKSFQISNSF